MESIAVTAATTVHAGACSAVGRDRDADVVVCGPTWFAIADGVGGHDDGDVAGRVVADALASEAAPRSLDDVAASIGRVDDAVRSAARRNGDVAMGATLVAAVPLAGGMAVAHVGDARCYRLTGGALTLLTHDHSYVQELVDLGRLTPDEARHHRLRHLVTRALGVDGAAQPEVAFVPHAVGRLLLCTDGLASTVSPRSIGRVLSGIDDPRAAADRLVALSTRAGSVDSVTALVVDDRGERS
ncbi:MAG: protein phosphatase 2C domain-containing protein [Ilumatobacteraceae bacterium]|nr:protein phosphatase 2C domain-containing protein [Ilumatobacteraceae bacterium]